MNNKLMLVRKELDNELDFLILKWLMIAKTYDNKKCAKCEAIQGTLNYGVKKYYCEHITKKIDKKLKKENKEVAKKVFAFTIYQDSQNNF